MHHILIRVCTLVCMPVLVTLAHASVPTQMTLQGKVSDAFDNPLPAGSKSFLFRVFDAPSLGAQVWPDNAGEAQTVSTDAAGLWTANLGAVEPLTDGVFSSDARWLEIVVDGTVLPRVRLAAVPYAQRASTVDGTSGGQIASKVTIGPGHNVTGAHTFVAGESNDALADHCTVAGGQDNGSSLPFATIGGGRGNGTVGTYATIAGGWSNTAVDSAATVGGGRSNWARAKYTSIGGGNGNFISERSAYSTVAGGASNSVSAVFPAGTEYGTIAGGFGNELDFAHGSAIGGGYDNLIDGVTGGAIAGGSGNSIRGSYGAIGGGFMNSMSGQSAMIPGGEHCTAIGYLSLAAGSHARTPHSGMFVWSDASSNSTFPNPADPNLIPGNNFFCCRTTGGAFFATGVNGSGFITSSALLPSGGGAWLAFSDKNAKHGFVEIDLDELLQAVVSLPITKWSYNAQGDSIRHIGPMAQDFHAAFGVGEDARYISPVDEAGVALAAIQALAKKLEEKDKQIEELAARIAALEKR